MNIILASASPRRAELLTRLGLSFEIVPAEIDEQRLENESGENLVKRLACEKALTIAKDFPAACIIAADTVVVSEKSILGKPKNDKQALAMLQSLAGKTHHVLTGIALCFNGRIWHKVIKSDVEMIGYDEKLFRTYILCGEPRDKAGAYGIQGRGGILIQKINGDFYNVVGLPLQGLREGLKALGLEHLLLESLAQRL